MNMSEQYPITYWYGIRKDFLSRERLIEAKEAGFNIIECAYDTKTNLQVLAWCQELGLRANVQDERMYACLTGDEGWEAKMDAIIADYADCPAVNRFFVRDEPVDDYFPTLGRVVKYLHAHDPKHGEYINLLPLVAVLPYEKYQAHIDGYLREVEPTILSYDHYNLIKREVPALTTLPEARVSDENRERNGWQNVLYEAWDRESYYDNMEMIRDSAARAGIPWMTIILLVEHWMYRWPTEGEVRWEAFNALTYGSTALSYFTYWTPGVGHSEPWSYHNGIILADGRRGEKYEIVKAINAELQTLYRGLLEARPGEAVAPGALLSEAVFHVGPEADTLVKPFAGYGHVSGLGGGRFVVGFFAGDRFMVTSKDHDHPQTLTVTADAPLLHLNKATGAWEPFGGTLTFAPGDGELFACV
ncbi:MAG: hypothetical protein ACI4WV_06355 [Eubacteriales bacterium]